MSEKSNYPAALYMRRSRIRKKLLAKHPGAVINPTEVLLAIQGDRFVIYSTDTGKIVAKGELADE